MRRWSWLGKSWQPAGKEAQSRLSHCLTRVPSFLLEMSFIPEDEQQGSSPELSEHHGAQVYYGEAAEPWKGPRGPVLMLPTQAAQQVA